MKNLDIPSPPHYNEIFSAVSSENENGRIDSMSLNSELKGKSIIEFPTIYVLLRPGSMPYHYQLNAKFSRLVVFSAL